RVMTRVPSMISWRHLAPPAFVAVVAALALLGLLEPIFLIALALVLAAHALASYAFALPKAVGYRAVSLALVPVVTLIIHAAYGAGLLAALPSLFTRARPQPVRPGTSG